MKNAGPYRALFRFLLISVIIRLVCVFSRVLLAEFEALPKRFKGPFGPMGPKGPWALSELAMYQNVLVPGTRS